MPLADGISRGGRAALGLLGALSPPRCVCCRELATAGDRSDLPAAVVLCGGCERRLPRARGRLPAGLGIDLLAVPLAYEGVGRELVAALKFRRLVAVAELAAELIAAELPPLRADTCLVPVPPAPRRRRGRGFDPGELIAVALAERLGLAAGQPLRRTDRGHQRGRGRADRLALPPRFVARPGARRPLIVVDDVITTGATLSACAAALAAAGAAPAGAVAFAQTPPPGGRGLQLRGLRRMIRPALDAPPEKGGRS